MVPLGGCFCCLSMLKPPLKLDSLFRPNPDESGYWLTLVAIPLSRRQNIERVLQIGGQGRLETHSLPGFWVVEFQFRSVQRVTS